jgi:ubiquinone/menaquinone biosynthesis C-methylase UbiE
MDSPYIRVGGDKVWRRYREKDPGSYPYTKTLCDYISKNVSPPSKLLEVAIGTGVPFADYFQKKGYVVFGVDLSSELIEVCRTSNPNIRCTVGNAEALPCANDSFDCVYCFNATFLFLDLEKAIDEMLRVVRLGGLVIFDVMNKHNKKIQRLYKRELFYFNTRVGTIIRYGSHIRQAALGRRFPFATCTGTVTMPSDPTSLYERFAQKANLRVFVRHNDDGSIEQIGDMAPFRAYERFVFSILKTLPD